MEHPQTEIKEDSKDHEAFVSILQQDEEYLKRAHQPSRSQLYSVI
jgi:hypothetical protein